MVIIAADWENNAEEWWEAAREESNPPKAFKPLLEIGGSNEIEVTEAEEKEIRQWAESLPGWGTGPEYAKTALLFDHLFDQE